MKKGSKMTHPSIIETPFPTLEETAKVYGVSLAHARRIARLGEKPRIATKRASSKSGRSVASKNAKRSRSTKSAR